MSTGDTILMTLNDLQRLKPARSELTGLDRPSLEVNKFGTN